MVALQKKEKEIKVVNMNRKKKNIPLALAV